MENLNNLDYDISRILSDKDLGIISMDVGRLESGSDSWEPLERVCDERVVGLHKKISELFKSVYKCEPINYLFEYFINVGIEQDIFHKTFPILPADDHQSYEDNYHLVKDLDEDIDKNAQLRVEEEEENYIRNLFLAEKQGSDIYNNPTPSNFFPCFVRSQEVFSQAVGYLFNRRLGEKRLRYITIVLFAYKYDGVYHFTHSAAIFSDNEEYLKKDITGLIFDKIRSGRYLDEVKSLQIKVKKESIKSAKAAIMSRNMSHNLGSHVMAYLKQKLASVTDILRTENNVLYNLYPTYVDNLKTEEIELPFLVGLGRFIGYLQERQDYIATISTDYIPYGAPVNLKDAIYDEINPDLRYMRHHDDGNRNRPFNILLNYIAKSEGLSRENMGRDKEDNDGNEFSTHDDILFGFAKYYGDDGKHVFGLNNRTGSDDEALTLMRGINFSLPGGLVGRQAIFSIFENLIRNAAKHGRSLKGDNLEFTLDIIDGLDIKKNNVSQLETRICDEKWVNLYKTSSDISDLYILSITDNRPSDSKLIEKIRDIALYEPFVDSSGSMTTANKGIKEIRISAAWLRGDMEESDFLRYTDAFNGNKFNKKAPLVAVEQDKEGHLRYLICVRKNHSVAIIMEGLNDGDRKLFESFSHRINSSDWSFFKDADTFLKEHDNSFSYIVVANEDVQKNIRPQSSNRVCVWSISNSERAELENDANGQKILRKIFLLFTRLNEDSPEIYIWDGKTANSPTCDKIIVSTSETNINDAQYVYLTHLANEKEFGKYWKSKHAGDYRNIKFVEGITGDNSTDRLVRREPLDEKWYYSHLSAMKKKVAIIDERLFRIIHNIDENSFVTGNQYVTEAISRINNDEDPVSIKKYLYDKDVFSYKDNVSLSRLENRDDIIAFLKDYGRRFIEVVSNNHLTAVYSEKGVDVFTVIPDENGNLAIVGCISSEYSVDTLYRNTFKKIAVFTKEENRISLVSYEPSYTSKYDYISIHQGILDKIYEYYGVKEYSSTNPHNDECKLVVTSELSKLLSSSYSIGKEFIPGFIIHSGRAKPTKEDMPQKFPFIQYAAIENAVKDCKFSLVELLDFAQYE